MRGLLLGGLLTSTKQSLFLYFSLGGASGTHIFPIQSASHNFFLNDLDEPERQVRLNAFIKGGSEHSDDLQVQQCQRNSEEK